MHRVLHITTVHPRFDTRIFLRECAHLASLGRYQVTLAVMDGKGDAVHHGVTVRDLGARPGNRLARMTTGWVRAYRHVRRAGCDVLHIHDPELLPVGWLASFGRCKAVFDMHENMPAQLLTKRWLPPWSRRGVRLLYRGLERLMLPRFAVVFAESSYRRDYPGLAPAADVLNLPDLARMPPPRVRPLLAPPDPGARARPFTVAYLGSMTVLRGVLNVVQAVGDLRRAGHPVALLCVGEVLPEIGDDPRFLAGVAEGWLQAPGRIDAPDCWEAIAGCGCGVATLLPVPNYLESYPTKLFEYMALALPVVASDFALYRSIIERTQAGLTVDPQSPAAIAAAILQLLQDPSRAAAFGRQGRAAVEAEFNSGAQSLNLERLYAGLLEQAPAAGAQ